MRTPIIEVPFAGTQLAFTNARIEATVQNDGVEVTGLSSGMLGGVVPPAVLWAVPGVGSLCPTGLHAVFGLIGAPDQNVAGPGLDTLNTSVGFLPCVIGPVSINTCFDADTGATIPNSDLDGDGTVENGECVLDPRMNDGYSAAVTFSAQKVLLRSQVSKTVFCP
jgi:hypothetical protein